MSEINACDLLAQCAAPITPVLLKICVAQKLSGNRRSAAGTVATRLHIIRMYLKSLQPHKEDQDMKQLSLKVLRQLIDACTWPEAVHLHPDFFISACYQHLMPFIPSRRTKELETSVIRYFNEAQEEELQRLNDTCLQIHDKCVNEEPVDTRFLPDTVPHLGHGDYSTHLNNGLFDLLEANTVCDPSLHGSSNDKSHKHILRHPARLCLFENHHATAEHDSDAGLDILVSSSHLKFWQEFHFRIQPHVASPMKFRPPSDMRFCRLLEEQLYTQIVIQFQAERGLYHENDCRVLDHLPLSTHEVRLSSVLRNYRLTPRDKVTLAYVFAWSYWQFYDSEMMRTKWTSETIYFMPEGTGERRDELPLRSYLKFPFAAPSEKLHDMLYDPHLSHRYPRILAIGILLLEVGLCKPFRTESQTNRRAQINLDHSIARANLRDLKTKVWNGFSKKTYFDHAIEFCLNSDRFSTPPAVRLSPVSEKSDEHEGLLMRREMFYKHVVQPLAWLAKTGFGCGKSGDFYIQRNLTDPAPVVASTIVPSQGQPQPEAAFHSAKTAVPEQWLENLRKINVKVERKRRQCGIDTPIRVAILDTGFDATVMGTTDDDSRLRCITQRKDFVSPMSSMATDTFGHGTFMTRLVMECAPAAEVIIARVASCTKDLLESQSRVAQAILWVGQECRADIISMSFGFPRDSDAIANAIQTVHSERDGKVIVLASAGNSPMEPESFPARHPATISIYATNCYGTFSEKNAKRPQDGSAVLGTFGDNIPDSLCAQVRTKFPHICQPGSSVATAVAAGICATMLAYGAVLPSIVDMDSTQSDVQLFKRMGDTHGMKALLYKMADERPGSKWFLNPISFWMRKSEDLSKYAAIHDCLWDYKVKLQHSP